MSTAAPPEVPGAGPGSITGTGNLSEGCPLCGAPLGADQEWCLRCGAAARTRLAAAPNWRAPLIAAAVLVALALGVLAAALVKLAGDSGPAPPARTMTVTTTASATTPVPGASTPLTTTSTPSAVTPAPSSSTPGASTGGASTSSVPTTTTTRAGGALSGLGGGTQAGR